MNARHPYLRRRRGFTLVELLVVITVLGLLMGMMMFALQGANEQARIDRTRSQVARIHELLMDRWEQYRSRPVPIRPENSYAKFGYTPATARSPYSAADMRLRATWELMRMELPERKTDILDDPVYLDSVPSLCQAYRRKLVAIHGPNVLDPAQTDSLWDPQHQSAECLYLILSTIRDGDFNGLDFFTSREIGDVDGDKVPEILDGWGRPIQFLRWAPAFLSTLQECDATKQPDPFDPLQIYKAQNHYALFPLVFSAGPDGVHDISFGDGSFRYSTTTPIKNDPYASVNAVGPIGKMMDVDGDGKEAYWDNITNHYIVVR